MSTATDCLACLQAISSEQKSISCSVCKNGYHFGQSCAGIAESSYAAMGPAKREKWRCKTCRTQENRSTTQSGATSSQNASQGNAPTVLAQLQAFGLKLDVLLGLKSSVDTLLMLLAKVDELLSLKPTVERLEAHIQELESKVCEISQKYNSVLEGTAARENKIRELELQHSELRATVTCQTETIQSLREEINSGEQYSRRANLEIHGMPFLAGENLRQSVSDLAANLALSNFQTTDILAVHRLPVKPGLTPVVLIKFNSTETRDCWLGARGKLRGLAQGAEAQKLYFNENLTKQNRQLFWMVRERAREKHYKFTWIKNGKIFVKKEVSSPLLRVDRMVDLDKIL